MASPLTNKKYLSIFIERLIPEFWRSRYPNYVLFVKYFLEYAEKDGNFYDKLTKLMDLKDFDSIMNLEDLVLKERMIDELYITFLGDVGARNVSDLLDQALFINHSTDVAYNKGSKLSFQFFFLWLLKGSIVIDTILNSDKTHDAQWLYDGTINYDNRPGINPFVYKITSTLDYNRYRDLLRFLHPAGVYVLVYTAEFTKYLNTDSNVYLYNVLWLVWQKSLTQYFYVAFYDASNQFVCMVKPYSTDFMRPAVGSEPGNFVLTLDNNSLWYKYNQPFQPDRIIPYVYVQANFSEFNFPNTTVNQKVITRTKLLYKPQISPSILASVFAYSSIYSEGEVIADIPYVHTGEQITIQNYINYNLVLKWGLRGGISEMQLGNTFKVQSTSTDNSYHPIPIAPMP